MILGFYPTDQELAHLEAGRLDHFRFYHGKVIKPSELQAVNNAQCALLEQALADQHQRGMAHAQKYLHQLANNHK